MFNASFDFAGHGPEGKTTNQQFVIETPTSTLNSIKITTDSQSVIVTPDTGAVITFVTYTPSPPISSNLDIPLVCNEINKLFRNAAKV